MVIIGTDKYHKPTDDEMDLIHQAGCEAAFNVLEGIVDMEEERDQVKLFLKAFDAASEAVDVVKKQLIEKHSVDRITYYGDMISMLVYSAFNARLAGMEILESAPISAGGCAIGALIRVAIAQQHLSDLEHTMSCDSEHSCRFNHTLRLIIDNQDK